MALFNYKSLAVAVGSMGLASTAYSAGLDRSGQDVTAFLQDGTYAEAVYTYIDPDVSGYDNGVTSGASSEASYVQGRATGDISEDYDFFRYGMKADINDRFSVGVLYDEPFGAAVNYSGDSNFTSQGGDATVSALTNGKITSLATAQASLAQLRAGFAGLQQIQTNLAQIQTSIATATAAGDTATVTALQAQAQALQTRAQTVASQIITDTGTTSLTEAQEAATKLGAAVNAGTVTEAQKGEGTNVEIRTNNATLLMGAKFGANNNFQVYGGPAIQRLTGVVHLRGSAYQGTTGYDGKMSPDTALGWVAGVAYSKPEIALKASLTYRSDITHKTKIAEVFPATGMSTTQDFEVTLPESYNLDFQTGISPTMLLTAKARYVPWSSFDIRPTLYTQTSNLPIISYDKDQWSSELGLAKKLNDKWVVSGNVGYDSGAGNPVSTLGPIEGYYSVGLGARYNLTKEWSVSAGAKYLMFGDATANLPNDLTAGKFENNDGVIAGLKLAYHSK